MNEEQILEAAPVEAKYFAYIFSSSPKSRPVFSDGVPGSNHFYWIEPEFGGGAWERCDVDSICVDAIESVRAIEDVRNIFSMNGDVYELNETVKDCRDTICYLRSKYDDND